MPTIHEVATFIESFIKAERQAAEAMLTAPYPAFREARSTLNDFAVNIRLSEHLVRFDGEPLPEADVAQQQLSQRFQPRQVLSIQRYQLDDRTLFAADLTGTYGNGAARTREIRFIIEDKPHSLAIISRQSPPNPAFPYWETVGGEDITLPDQVDEQINFYDEEASS